MVLKEGGLLSLCVCIGVPLSLMVLEEGRLLRHQAVGVLMVLKEGGLLSLCTGVPLPSMVLEEGGLLCVLLVCS